MQLSCVCSGFLLVHMNDLVMNFKIAAAAVAADTAVMLVAGSPFQFTVGPVKNGGAHKIVAVGPGLQSATVNQPGTSFC